MVFFSNSCRVRFLLSTVVLAVVFCLVGPAACPGQTVSRPPVIESLELETTPSILQRIDASFESAVEAIAWVLFRRLGAAERQYVQLNHVENYVRPAGSEDAFARHDPEGTFEADSLSEQQVAGLAARGKLVLGAAGNSMRLGKIGNEEIQYVAVSIDRSGKFVLVPEGDGNDPQQGLFKRVLAKRDLLSDTDVKSWNEVEALAHFGRLQLDPEDPDREDAFLQSESYGGVPIVVAWLAAGSVFFTFYMGWFNLWGFRHAIEIVRGRYDNPDEPGEITHMQALASALSATVGLGNIAGVTIAMTMGGPGAFFWMVACGVFGMTSKFVECTLGQKYRRVKPDGTVLGGPMQYLKVGLQEIGLGQLGLVLSILFSVMCIMASFGGGNMFQANQSASAMVSMLQRSQIRDLEQLDAQINTAASENRFDELATLQASREELANGMASVRTMVLVIFGIVLALVVGFVIIGGIRRIGAAAEKLVPSMCLIYIVACLWIILSHITEVPVLITSIFTEAFTGEAFGGGFVGVMVLGIQRAAFSNEAGVGSAAIAHSAAKTEEPVREGAVALLGPFIDTVVVCSMTALVILITGAWNHDPWVVDQGLAGAALTSVAFEGEISWFPYVLAVAVVLFAFSTIISWSYYGERCWENLFGARSIVVYRLIYVTCVFVGAIVNLGAVLDFSDMMILSMAFPNVLGVALLAPKVKRDLKDYWRRYKANEFRTFN